MRVLTLAMGAAMAALLGAAAAGPATEPWAETMLGRAPAVGALSGTLGGAELEALRARGEFLFSASFTSLDGVGRPMATQAIIPTKRKRPVAGAFHRLAGLDANSCASCHNAPRAGGAGDFVTNVFTSEGFSDADFDSSDPQFSNERNTNHLFGAGLLELLAREMTAELQQQRFEALRQARASGIAQTANLSAKSIGFGTLTARPDGIVELGGIEGVDTDLVIRPFSQKGVMTSLRQFTVNALNHHHGMEAVERFGIRWTGEADFDEDGVDDEITDLDVSALVAFQATLPPPVVRAPDDEAWRAAAGRGDALFDTVGCAACHVRALPLDSPVFSDPGPLDAAGTLRASEADNDLSYDLTSASWAASLPRNERGQLMVPLFGDLKRHKLADQQVAALGNELLAQRFVERDVFQTTELWGIGSTAPYGHRGDFTTLDEVIRAHGGEGRASRDAYLALPQSDRSALIAYLRTLVIE